MHEFNTTIRILYDNDKQFPIEHRKLKVSLEKENDCISRTTTIGLRVATLELLEL